MKMTEDEVHASFWEHVEELRSVVLRSLVAIFLGVTLSLYFYEELIHFFTEGQELFIFSPIEGFIAIFRLSFWAGALCTAPYWIGGLIRFAKPALRGREKEWIPLFFILSTLFIALGFLFCLKVTLPLTTLYLFDFNRTLGTNLWGLSVYLDFVLMLFFAHGALFQIGALLFFLIKTGLIQAEHLAKKRRHAIVASLIVAAFLTPPDVLSQVALAVPLILFYELAILYGSYFTRT